MLDRACTAVSALLGRRVCLNPGREETDRLQVSQRPSLGLTKPLNAGLGGLEYA